MTLYEGKFIDLSDIVCVPYGNIQHTRVYGLEEGKVEVTGGEDCEPTMKRGEDVAPIVEPGVCQD